MPAEFADKPCHTCRRRRLRCDRSLPSCKKCSKGGRECLGYQKCLIWANGVASRGKMMGKSFGVTNDCNEQCSLAPVSSAGLSLSNSNNSLVSRDSPSCYQFIAKEFPFVLEQSPLVSVSASKNISSIPFPLLRPLIDPLFQDLDTSLRYYISYFANNFSKLFCIREKIPSKNPMRDCLPLMQENSVLLYAITATSAYHICNAESEADISNPGTSTSTSIIGVASSIWRNGSDRIHYTNALIYKERALKSLISVLKRPEQHDNNAALAAIYFLANFELLETGRDNWKIHLDGAKRLIGHLETETMGSSNPDASPLHRYIAANCLCYDILGSTLAAHRLPSALAYNSEDVKSILRDNEPVLFTSCPTDLLQIIVTVSELSKQTDSRCALPIHTSSQSQGILLRLAAFNPWSWARELRRESPTDSIDARAHVASAYKYAVSIYIRRALFIEMPNSSASDDASSVIHHLSYIAQNNELFEATVWPTFFAGAEIKSESLRRWIVERLNAIFARVMFFNVKNAVEVLNLVWQASDEKDENFNWIQEVGALGSSWLFV